MICCSLNRLFRTLLSSIEGELSSCAVGFSGQVMGTVTARRATLWVLDRHDVPGSSPAPSQTDAPPAMTGQPTTDTFLDLSEPIR